MSNFNLVMTRNIYLILGYLMTPEINNCTVVEELQGFEGVEKRIEIRFSASYSNNEGLRGIDRITWDEICSKCKCEIIHYEPQDCFDSYILSESSLFVFSTKVMMKTCGTTVPLDSVDLIVKAASVMGMFPLEMIYSRSDYMFPLMQPVPYNSFASEINHLAKMEIAGSVIPGKSSILESSNGRHWFVHRKVWNDGSSTPRGESMDQLLPSQVAVDIIMTGLCASSRKLYYQDPLLSSEENHENMRKAMSMVLPEFKSIVGKCFEPCGYSCNAHQAINDDYSNRYATVHVTPEAEFSYASVEVVFNLPYLMRDISPNDDTRSWSVETNQLINEIQSCVERTIAHFNPKTYMVNILSSSTDVSATTLMKSKPHVKIFEKHEKTLHTQFPEAYTSENLLGEDLVASSVFYSNVSSGNTGTKPTGLS